MSGNDWQTPETVLDRVRSVSEITLDPCTTRSNPVGAEKILTPEDDPCGLFAEWSVIADGGLVFANIPFGRGVVAEWAAKIIAEARAGCEIIALTRGDMSTRWARLLINAASGVCFPPRIKFKGATGSPNFSNALLYFGPRREVFRHAFGDLGPVIQLTPSNRNEK